MDKFKLHKRKLEVPKIIWLSSYPKSGNTWLRYLIANYFFNKEKKINHSIIRSISKFPKDSIIEKLTTKNELKEAPYNISKYWSRAQEIVQKESFDPLFLKNHNSILKINENNFTNQNFSKAVIYIVRDPRDVAVSYSIFRGENLDKTVKIMCSENTPCTVNKTANGFYNIEVLGSWKQNYLSWKNSLPNIPKIIIRYEDLIFNCGYTFNRLISFLSDILNFKIDIDQINFSIENSDFNTLSKMENEFGFPEAKNGKFFRSGKIGDWKNYLSKDNINNIENYCQNEMKELNYL